jgi:hypothetical protein
MADFHAAVELDATRATLLAHRQGSQFLECPRGLTARLGVIDRQVLPTAVGHAEPIAAQMNFANARVTHVDSAVAVTDIPTRPQIRVGATSSEVAAGGRAFCRPRQCWRPLRVGLAFEATLPCLPAVRLAVVDRVKCCAACGFVTLSRRHR